MPLLRPDPCDVLTSHERRAARMFSNIIFVREIHTCESSDLANLLTDLIARRDLSKNDKANLLYTTQLRKIQPLRVLEQCTKQSDSA